MRGALVAVALLLGAQALADAPPGKRLAPFVLKDTRGDDYNIGQHAGRHVVVIAFWATWCKPCKLELKALHELYLKYRDRGLRVLAVSIDGPESVAEVVGYRAKYGFEFPVLLDSDTALLERYNPRGDVPFSMVIARSGDIVETHQGYNPGDEIPLEKRLLTLLEAPVAENLAPADVSTWSGYTVEGTVARVEGTETLQLRYLQDNYNTRPGDDDVFMLQNKLTLGAAYGALSAGIRSDNTAFPGYDEEDRCADARAVCPWNDDHRIERYWVDYRAPKLTLRAGDFYHQVGRGLVFSVRKIEEIGTDTTIRGGRAAVTLGPARVQAFGGVSNVQNMDLLERGFVEEVDDKLVGGDVTVELPYDLSIGARGLFVDYEASAIGTLGESDEGDQVAGGHFAARNVAGLLDLYFEGAFIRNIDTRTLLGRTTVEEADGYGLYGSATLTPVKGLSILLEVKDYRRFDLTSPSATDVDSGLPLTYHEPPTLERIDQIIDNTSNGTGGRILAEYYVESLGLLVYLNATYYGWLTRADAEADPDELASNFDDQKGNATLHLYAGFETRWESGHYVALSGGYRLEGKHSAFGDALGGGSDFKRRLWHLESDIQIPLAGKHSLGVRTNHRTEEKQLVPGDAASIHEFSRGDVSITYGFAPHLTASLLYFYSEEDESLDADDPEDFRRMFLNFGGEVTWHFAAWGQVTVFYGRNTAGLVCANGVCRWLPAFEGFRGEVVLRF